MGSQMLAADKAREISEMKNYLLKMGENIMELLEEISDLLEGSSVPFLKASEPGSVFSGLVSISCCCCSHTYSRMNENGFSFALAWQTMRF